MGGLLVAFARARSLVSQWIIFIFDWSSLIIRQVIVYLFGIKNDEVNEFFRNKKNFFILSMGRSGTKWLSTLLDKNPKAIVFHEPFPEAIPYQLAFKSAEAGYKYILEFRRKYIYLRIRNLDATFYGEVNGYLRRHVKALKKTFPNATFIHLVRDGRDVVRSMYSRETMLPGAVGTRMIFPHKNDPYYGKWNTMSRFEKLCWYWTVENKYIRINIGKTVQFEKMLTNYKYFKKNVLEPLNLDISNTIWLEAKRQPKNISKTYKLPYWTKWTFKMRQTFEQICGEEMSACGYVLNWDENNSNI